MSLYARLAAALAILVLIASLGWKVHHWDQTRLEAAREQGREQIRTDWRKQLIVDQAAKEEETARRLKAQQENQRAQNAQLAAARADADRAHADADRVREQSVAAASAWSARLADSPTAADLAAASATIRVQSDLLGRAVSRARLLATNSDAARAAGLKCERDYDALSPPH